MLYYPSPIAPGYEINKRRQVRSIGSTTHLNINQYGSVVIRIEGIQHRINVEEMFVTSNALVDKTRVPTRWTNLMIDTSAQMWFKDKPSLRYEPLATDTNHIDPTIEWCHAFHPDVQTNHIDGKLWINPYGKRISKNNARVIHPLIPMLDRLFPAFNTCGFGMFSTWEAGEILTPVNLLTGSTLRSQMMETNLHWNTSIKEELHYLVPIQSGEIWVPRSCLDMETFKAFDVLKAISKVQL